MDRPYFLLRFFEWVVSCQTLIFCSVGGQEVPKTMTLVSAGVTFLFPLIPIYLHQYSRLITLADFFMFALWLTTTCLSGVYLTTCHAVGTGDSCGGDKMLIGFSTTQSFLHLFIIVLRVVFVHLPSWKEGVPEDSSGEVLDEQAVNGNLELGVVAVAPEAGEDLELDTIVLTRETAEDVKIDTFVMDLESGNHAEFDSIVLAPDTEEDGKIDTFVMDLKTRNDLEFDCLEVDLESGNHSEFDSIVLTPDTAED